MIAAPTWTHIFIDVPAADWERSPAFWSAATATELSAPWGDDAQYVSLEPAEGDAWVHLQRIDGPARVHIDLDSADPAEARSYSLVLGAEAQWERLEALAMTSAGGLWFCHSRDGGRTFRRSDPERVLDQVCIDIPQDLWETEVAFWRDLTARELTKGGQPEFAFLGDDGAPRILLQRVDETGDRVRAHPDFAVADRAAETHRHEALGAEAVGTFPWWTVLRAPDGRAYCLTDRDPMTGNVRAR